MVGLETLQQWLPLLASAAIALLALFIFFNAGSTAKEAKKLRLPPGPAGVPVFGSLGIFVSSSHPHQEMDRLAKEHGPLMSIRMGSKLALVVSSPEMAKEVLKTFDKEFANRPRITAKDAMCYGDYTMGYTSYGPRWRFTRKTATLELLTPKRTQQFKGVREEECSAMIRSIFEDSQKSGVVDINQRTTYLTMNIMTRILMNKKFYSYSKTKDARQQPADKSTNGEQQQEKLAREFKELIEQVFFLAGVSLIGDVIPYLGFLDRIMNHKAAMQKVHHSFDSFLAGVLEEHRQHQRQSTGSKAERDFVDILLALPGEDGAPHLDEPLIKALLMDTLTAGTDTSSITIEWGLAELLRHPHLLRRLQAELDRVIGTDRLVSESDIPNLPYLHAVVKEVFRLHPAAPLLIPHETSQACHIAGYDIPAGTITFVNAWSIARNPAAWDRPLEFLPERFVGSNVDVRGQHYELLPFGSGRRGCPGMHLGLAVVHFALARLVHSFDWTLPQGQAPQDLDMTEKFGLTLPRAKPLRAVPSPRLPAHLY